MGRRLAHIEDRLPLTMMRPDLVRRHGRASPLTAENDQRLRGRGSDGSKGLLDPGAPLLATSATAAVPVRPGRRNRIVLRCFERPGEDLDEVALESPRFGS